jgi:Fe-S cluster assembly protein SufD
MTTMTIQDQGMLLEGHPALGASRAGFDPDWLRDIRAAARSDFESRGLPTLRDEAWRFTSLKALAGTTFAPAPDAPSPLDAAAVAACGVAGLDGVRLVFVNGRYVPEASVLDGIPAGVTVCRFADATGPAAAALEAHLARSVASGGDPLAALNTACFDDGVLVHVDDGVEMASPICVLSITSSPDVAIATHPRHLVVAGVGSRVTVVEDYVGPDGGVYLTNAVTEIAVGANADVHHYMLVRESLEATNVSTLRITQERDSRFTSHSALVGGGLVRNNVNPVLNGENCFSVLNGLYVGVDGQHLDNNMRVDHTMPHCDSRQYYKGILRDKARGVFTGRIVVARDAQKTDAVQSNANLLLSKTAQANTQPQLEIYADDVKCTHGATIGELDENAIFYLRARGLSEASARGLLVHAFAMESLDRMELAPVRTLLETLMLERLPRD